MSDLKPFKLDIDDLISDFSQGESTTLVDMKKVWLSKKFTFIFEASPSTNQACFMQSLYAYAIGYMMSTASLSHRLGGLYCLYCLYETQPFKPPFKIYLSLGELKRLKHLVVESKKKDIKVVSVLVKRMLEKNIFLFGFVDTNESSVTQRVNELADMQNTRVQVAQKKLFADTRIEHFLHMDLGMELDIDLLKKMSTDYAGAKEQAIRGAIDVVDVQNIKHIAENNRLIGDVVAKTSEDWNAQKELFYQQTKYGQHKENQNFQGQESSENNKLEAASENFKESEDNENVEEQDDNESFSKELEDDLLAAILM